MRSEKFSFHFLTCSIWGLMGLTVVSGIFLLAHYVPTFAQAFPSVQKINEQVPFGWMFQRLHAVGGSFLLLLFLVHLIRVFYTGGYKSRPELLWVMEVLLVVFAVGAHFSGFFLPLSQEAFWGTAATLSALSTVPWIGNFMVEFLRGGRELGGTALARFLSMHMGFAAGIVLLLLAHFRGRSEAKNRESIWNGNLVVGTLISGLLIAAVTFTPYWFTDSLREAANPTMNARATSSPWYSFFLQETLPFLNSAYPVLTLILAALILSLVFFLPYIDRNPERKLLSRPVSLSIGSALIGVIVYFTFLGMAGAHYGARIVVPISGMSAAEIRGAQVFARKNCAYCHQVFGREGRREGPDMAVAFQRKRAPEWLQRFILNPRLYQPGTTMPKYDIPLEDLEGLSAYLLSLDPGKKKFHAVNPAILDFGPSSGNWERK